MGFRTILENIGSHLWAGFLALASAVIDLLILVPASFLVSGLIMRRDRGEPIDLFDAMFLVGVVIGLGFLVRRMYRSPERSLDWVRGVPKGEVGPNASLVHFLFDGLFIWFGISLWTGTKGTLAGPVEELGIGPGFVIVFGLLAIVRVYSRIRHREEKAPVVEAVGRQRELGAPRGPKSPSSKP